ncbi:MAG: hypothetical protein ACTSYA_12775 [Candidatus Kariarchaeaceae archaeon]
MMDLPEWFPLQKQDSLNVERKYWVEEANLRLSRLTSGEKWTLNKTPHLPQEEWENRVSLELAGHVLMRMASSMDDRLTGWLIEVEGDLFEYRFEKTPIQKKMAILRALFGSEAVFTLSEFSRTTGRDLKREFGLSESSSILQKQEIVYDAGGVEARRSVKRSISDRGGQRRIITVRFDKASDLVNNKKVLLVEGFAIAPLMVFNGTIKSSFEKQLRQKIRETKEQLMLLGDKNPVNDILDKITKKMNREIEFAPADGFSIELLGKRAQQDFDLYPPCILRLIGDMRVKGYLTHENRLQLGLFLKAMGMSVDDQLRFWYEYSVDNVGTTYEEFLEKSNGGYQVRFLYGLEGAGTDYKAQKCKTLQNRYFCFFKHTNINNIVTAIENRFHEEHEKELLDKVITSILSSVTRGYYWDACSRYLSLLSSPLKKTNTIYHPVQYVQQAVKKTEGKKASEEQEKDKTDSEKNKTQQETQSEEERVSK